MSRVRRRASSSETARDMAPVVELSDSDSAAAVKLPASTTRAKTRMFCKVSMLIGGRPGKAPLSYRALIRLLPVQQLWFPLTRVNGRLSDFYNLRRIVPIRHGAPAIPP